MHLFVTILHVILCVSLILIILLQPGKEGAAAFGGGGGNQMYGPRGQGHFLGRATTVVAALFMFTSITLAWYSSAREQSDADIEIGIDELEVDEDGFDIALPDRAPDPVTPDPAPVPSDEGSSGLEALDVAPPDDSVAPSDSSSGAAGEAP